MSKNKKEFEIVFPQKAVAILKLYEPRSTDESFIFPLLDSDKNYSKT